MQTFTYKAKQGPEKEITGVVEADNLDAAIQQIIRSGYSPIDVVQMENKIQMPKGIKFNKSLFAYERFSQKDITEFTRNLSDMLEASVPVLQAIKVIAAQAEKPKHKEIFIGIQSSLEKGYSLSEALAQHKDHFSKFYIQLVKTGEMSGELAKVLARLADYLEKERDVNAQVLTSLMYPGLILTVGIATVFVLLSFVVPRISLMLEDIGQELPWQTALLVNLSGFFASTWWFMALLVVVGGYWAINYVKTEAGKTKWDAFLLKVPFLSQFLRNVELGRVARTLGALLESNLDIRSALQSVERTIANDILRSEMSEVIQEVTHGAAIHRSLKKSSLFTDTALNLVSVSEQTGNLKHSFNKIADIYERRSNDVMKTIVSLLGPIVLIGIFVIVGCIVVAMLLPILKMNLMIG